MLRNAVKRGRRFSFVASMERCVIEFRSPARCGRAVTLRIGRLAVVLLVFCS